jgi:hypothetical protein
VPHWVEGLFDWLPATTQAIVESALSMPRPGGFIARPMMPRHAGYWFPPAPLRVMVADPWTNDPRIHCFLLQVARNRQALCRMAGILTSRRLRGSVAAMDRDPVSYVVRVLGST